MVRTLLALVVVAALGSPARADDGFTNFLIGPVFGLRLSGPSTGGIGVVGLEGGVGWGPERINLGFVHRADRMFYYGELDPWLWIGGTFGFGVDSEGEAHPVLGIWEGFPIGGAFRDGCSRDGFQSAVTLAGGLRYTGVVELYVTVKAGVSQGIPCF